MYIVDKHKDFYDYYSHLYGIDKKVVFDRRLSKRLSEQSFISLFVHLSTRTPVNKKSKRYVVLEVGTTQYLFKLHNFEVKEEKVLDYDIEIIRVFRENKHLFKKPITIMSADPAYVWSYRKGRRYLFDSSFDEAIQKTYNKVSLPILAATKLTTLLDPEKIWIELQTYISSLDNDVDTSTPMTDVEKAINHGFDKKTSFRNPIK